MAVLLTALTALTGAGCSSGDEAPPVAPDPAPDAVIGSASTVGGSVTLRGSADRAGDYVVRIDCAGEGSMAYDLTVTRARQTHADTGSVACPGSTRTGGVRLARGDVVSLTGRVTQGTVAGTVQLVP